MESDFSQTLIESVGGALTGHGFRDRWRPKLSALDCRGLWRLCTVNVNRAVALLNPPIAELEVGPYCQRMKWRLLWKTWFVPLFYELGLQIVLFGQGLQESLCSTEGLRAYVDSFSNQFVVLQSIFVVDTATRKFTSARTWGQVITGKYQDAIAAGIEAVGFESM